MFPKSLNINVNQINMAEGSIHHPIQTPLQCEICEGYEDVSWFCQKCAGRLCASCKTSHPDLGPVFRNHTIVPVIDALKEQRMKSEEEQCSVHRSYSYSLHCEDCHKLVCTECITEAHRGHNLGKIADVMQKVEKEIEEFNKALKTVLLANCETEEKNSERDIQGCNQWYSSLQSEIKKKRTELKNEIDNVCDDLLHNAAEVKDKNIEKMTRQRENLQDFKKDIELIVTSNKDIMTKSNSTKIQYNKEKPKFSDFCVPQSTSPQLPMYISGKINRNQIAEQVGFLQNQLHDVQVSHSKTTPVKAETNVSTYPKLSCPIKTHLEADPQLLHPVTARASDTQVSLSEITPVVSAKVVFKENIYTDNVYCQGKAGVWIQSISSNKVVFLTVQGKTMSTIVKKFYIDDFILAPNGDIIATDSFGNFIRRLSQNGQVKEAVKEGPWRPTGICLANNKQDIVVCLSLDKGSVGSLVIYNEIFNVIKRIRYTDRPICDNIQQRVTQTPANDYIIVHRGRKMVYVLDSSGLLKFIYDGIGAGQMKEPFYPYDICCDRYNRLLVSDYSNHTVHIVDQSGKYLQMLLTAKDGLVHPTGLDLDTEGKLWIGHKHANLFVVKYLKE